MRGLKLTEELSVSPQISAADVAVLAAQGFRSIVCNRPDGEAPDQPVYEEIEAAARAKGLEFRYLPVAPGMITPQNVEEFRAALRELPKPVLAFCRSGTRSATLWALSEAPIRALSDILARAKAVGYDLSGVAKRIADAGNAAAIVPDVTHEIVIVGGGAAGIAVAASLLARRGDLDVAVIEPAETHYYQPGWTLVGAGVFEPRKTARPMAQVLPRGVRWIKGAVAAFEPDANAVILEGYRIIGYKRLIVCPGVKLDWHAVEGLADTIGQNGVTSNYRYDLAPYTWRLVNEMKAGKAVFTMAPMPIKCAGAPQKALYLSANFWEREGRLKDIEVSYFSAPPVLFGVLDYVPTLMRYIRRYGVDLNLGHNLVAIDGPGKMAWFEATMGEGRTTCIEVEFDMIHVCPPQTAPDFIRTSPLADKEGWVEVDHATLRHKRYGNIYALGDVTSTPNAKTAGAARKQAPVVAMNVLKDMAGGVGKDAYDGYGSCPLTVEYGKVVLAEFAYGGKLSPTFPSYIINGKRPSRLAWWLKERILPKVYWWAMLKGREWLAKPKSSEPKL